MRLIHSLFLPLAVCALIPAAALAAPPASPVSQSRADAAFDAVVARFLASATHLSPVEATVVGDHRHDGLLPDITPAGRAAKLREWRTLQADLGRIPASRLSRANQVDRAMLANDLNYRIWTDLVLQPWAWNAQAYGDTAANALYGLAARDFAPWDVRLRAATVRMEKLPAFLAEARRQLVVARVPRVYAETASRQNGGIAEIVSDMLLPHADSLTGVDRARFDAAFAGLKTAVAEHQAWLDGTLVPGAKGNFRLGPKLYDQKMAFTIVGGLPRAALKQKALAAFAATRAEMYQVARKALASRLVEPVGSDLPMPDRPTAAQQQAVIEAALKLSYAKRPPRDQLEQRARETLVQTTAFVRAKDLIRMPDGPVRVITMPKFQQGFSVAYNDPPGPLDKGLQNYYAVSPVPADWTQAQADSFLSEYNDYMIHNLGVHEAMPGHYVQLDHANASPSVLRAYLGAGPFIEGWAVYAEGVVKDAGYLDGDPLYQLTVLKMRLRSVTNTLLDIGIQTEGMSREAAMTLMMKGAFQQEREAAGKWTRASLSSTQLLEYFSGYQQHLALRAEAEKRWGKDFTLRRYHDTALSFGSPPVKYVRALMFGGKAE
ncbi:MAG: DUF885 domain-containing protein [Novosphingobium sp.]|uniref:DUF885 domain-containing protein n=1 Tax=Novosphingobium sp. TaxID=1874826 RepID=UPI0032B7D939